MAQFAIEEPDNNMPGADLKFSEHKRAVNPGALDNIGNVGRKIENGGCAARKLIERRYQIGSDPGWVELEMLDDAVDVGVLGLKELVQPMNCFNVGIATHLAKNGGTFDGLIGDRVEFAKQRGSSDFSHNNVLCVALMLEGEGAFHNPFLRSITLIND